MRETATSPLPSRRRSRDFPARQCQNPDHASCRRLPRLGHLHRPRRPRQPPGGAALRAHGQQGTGVPGFALPEARRRLGPGTGRRAAGVVDHGGAGVGQHRQRLLPARRDRGGHCHGPPECRQPPGGADLHRRGRRRRVSTLRPAIETRADAVGWRERGGRGACARAAAADARPAAPGRCARGGAAGAAGRLGLAGDHQSLALQGRRVRPRWHAAPRRRLRLLVGARVARPQRQPCRPERTAAGIPEKGGRGPVAPLAGGRVPAVVRESRRTLPQARPDQGPPVGDRGAAPADAQLPRDAAAAAAARDGRRHHFRRHRHVPARPVSGLSRFRGFRVHQPVEVRRQRRRV